MSSKHDRAQAIEYLREQVGNHATRDHKNRPILYFIVRRVSASGMSRVMSTYYVTRDRGSIVCIDHLIAAAGLAGARRTDEGYRVPGCGMDMRFHVADCLAHACGIPYVADGNDIDVRGL